MDYFNNTVNGMSLFHDDFRFIQDSLIAGIEAMAKAFTINSSVNFIISGCDATLDIDLTITSGWIYLNDEVLFVPAQSITYNSGKYYIFEKETTLDITGERSVNGVIVNPYQLIRAKLVEVDTILSTQLAYNGLTVSQVLSKKTLFTPQWKKVGDIGNLQLGGNFVTNSGSYNYGLKYKLTNSGDLHIFGSFQTAVDLATSINYTFISLLNFYQFLDPSVTILTGGISQPIYETKQYRIELHYQKDNISNPPDPELFNLTFIAKEAITAGTPLSINIIIPLNFDNALKTSPYDN